ncbi:VCBS repeat-containing protein [Danxiaibacter flavus]|uniref:VCBS repeat-containing protein n=1 Tax=Danxiaibacter flavus TaxID=3049108 RepID=A0ABV3ZK04_9BACT|nr:VCBS repeat-containing protein [Chitinophagaceae bacterium DXS]
MRLLKIFALCFFLFCFLACNNKKTLFEEVPSSHSGITFNNRITESDSLNPIDVVNIYNGGGVGVGDFNNDGLQDIFLTGNMVSSKLYLNKGSFKFTDVTDDAGVDGMGRWARGVAVIDINNDGLLDVYICNTIYKDSLKRRNILYVNQGIDKNGIPHFKDQAEAYGLDINVQSTMASFFDYDNDGDLDMYLTVNEASNGYDASVFTKRNSGTQTPSMGRLYRNDMDETLKHPVFHNVSQQAGIVYAGFGHAATICDLNNDGWKDIYISDDFISNNLLYINNHNGTFTDRSKEYFKHTSFNAMGQDVIDINNDGLPDVIELDMSPEDNYRKKTMTGASNYLVQQNFDQYGYQYQYVRNTLQLNQGMVYDENDSIARPVFSDIGFMSGISQTDWSWTPLVTDFDNDGYRDIIITNGFPKDVSDRDFIVYRKQSTKLISKQDLIKQIPEVKLHNYAYRNNGNLTFNDVTNNWGLSVPTFSNGAVYADLDNDGDMDVVINNVNDETLVYKNTVRDKNDSTSSFLSIKFVGSAANRNGIGASATVFYDHGKQQVYENNPYRGYLSTMQTAAHFGLGNVTSIDSVIIQWNDQLQQKIVGVKPNQVLTVNIKDARRLPNLSANAKPAASLFKDITKSAGITYKHQDRDLIDFNQQSVLPHKFSEYNPALAVADMNGDGLDDIVSGGNLSSPAQLFLQQKNGSFIQKNFLPDMDRNYRDEGILLFDANGDGKTDVYIVSGGFREAEGDSTYLDRLYVNDGKGHFTQDLSALPANTTSKLCVKAFDYNGDGLVDLFVSGRVKPGRYPQPVSSFIYRNDSRNGKTTFTDVTADIAPALKNIGLVCDALFTDFNNDGQPDLILAGEWMPVTFFQFKNGKFEDVTKLTGIADKTGWFNSIVAGDFRHTGRTDYIIGNAGLNTFYKASDEFPVYITASDFEKNGGYLSIPSLYLPDSSGVKKEFPANGRDDIIERMPSIRKRFPDYRSFARATVTEIFTPEKMKTALRLKANMLQSCFVRNDGNGRFTLIPLPVQAQMSVLDGMVADDFDGDGNLDVLMNGNDFGTDVTVGRYDALNGLLLKGDGKGNFQALSIAQSGIFIPGDGKSLVKLLGSNGNYLVAASQHKDYLKLFRLNTKPKTIRINNDDMFAMITYKNGSTQKQEFYYGDSFLSQSSRFITINENVSSVTVTNNKGAKRNIPL